MSNPATFESLGPTICAEAGSCIDAAATGSFWDLPLAPVDGTAQMGWWRARQWAVYSLEYVDSKFESAAL